jgi:hypothetical protein
VSELGDLLELIHGATTRVASVRATMAEFCRPELLEVAFRRFGDRTGFARGGGYFYAPLGGVAVGERADEHVWEIKLWADAGRFRVERVGPDVESVLVVDHERWWNWSPAFGLRSHEDEPGVRHHGGLDLLDASGFVVGFDLEVAGRTVVAGRPSTTVRVRGARTEGHPVGLALGIEEADLQIDSDRGVVLRRTELVDGQPAFVREVETITYDEPLPPDVFVFTPPPGTPARKPAKPQWTTLDEAASLASFPVLKLAEVPPDWRVDAIVAPAPARPTRPESVTLAYTRRDGGERLEVYQMTQIHELPVTGEERRFEYRGRAYSALGPVRPAGREPAVLIFAVNATQVRITSSAIPLESLLEFAGALVEA